MRTSSPRDDAGRAALGRRQKLALTAAGGAGLLAFAGVLWFFRGALAQGVNVVGKEAFRAALLVGTPHGRAAAYVDPLWQVAQEEGVSPFLLVGIMERESASGQALTPPGPAGTGDYGHGRGLMQLDDRSLGGTYQGAVIRDGRWQDPYWNIKTAAHDHVVPDMAFFAQHGYSGVTLTKAVLAAYNAGPGNVLKALQAGKDPDSVTTGANYGSDTLAKITALTNAAPV